MTNPTIEINLAEILGEIRQDLKQLSSNVSDLKVGQARLEEKVNNIGQNYQEFQESKAKNCENDTQTSTKKSFDSIQKLIKEDLVSLKEMLEEMKDAQKN